MNLKKNSPYFWIPTLYFAEGAPATIIAETSLIIFKNFGMDDASNTFWKNLIGLVPLFIVKLLGGPLIDSTGSKRAWIIAMQLLMSMLFVVSASFCLIDANLMFLIGTFMLIGFISFTHDIAADGFYIIALSERDQALFSGLRSTFFRIAMILANGGLLMLASSIMEARSPETGEITKSGLEPATAWGFALFLPAIILGFFALWHFIFIPKTQDDQPAKMQSNEKRDSFISIFASFFTKKHIVKALIFILIFRLAEAQLGDVSRLFFLNDDGLGISQKAYSYIFGTLGVISLLAGGIVSGLLVAAFGMGKMLYPMVLAINLPNLVYVFLAFLPTKNMRILESCVIVEQFGYGFGFTGFMLFMVWFAATSVKNQTSHYAILTVFMISGLRLPAMASGWILEHISGITNFFIQTQMTKYQLFFIWVMICTIPVFAVTWMVKKIVDPLYGLKKKTPKEVDA